MKIGGIEICVDNFCIWNSDNVAIFLPFLKVRRYELLKVTSIKTDESIKHKSKLKYPIRDSHRPIDVLLSRVSAETRLKRDNEQELNSLGLYQITSSKYLTY